MNDFHVEQKNSPVIISTSNHLDHVYSYFGQNYGTRESRILQQLNILSQNKGLLLHQSQTSSRDVRIILPNQIPIDIEDANEIPEKPNKKKSQFGNRSKSNYIDVNEDDLLIFGQSQNYCKPESGYRQFENKNYLTFLHNFNQIAASCYLKAMKAPAEIWQLYSLNKHLENEASFNW